MARTPTARPASDLEDGLRRQGFRLLAGVDEAGRGPLAGPVVAAAVLICQDLPLSDLDDSKRLTVDQRERLFDAIHDHALGVGVGVASVVEIDACNIRQATLLAMTRAVAALPELPEFILVDGRDLPSGLPVPGRAEIGGDARSPLIAAASIIAKVTRDRMMDDLAREYPGYGWESNRGYPTRGHRDALVRLGVTSVHRRTFAPVRRVLGIV